MFRTSPVLPVTLPNEELVGLKFAPLRFGWLNTSKASARNCRPLFSLIGKVLNRPTFQFEKPGLWTTSRMPFWVTKVPLAGLVKIGEPSGLVVVNQRFGSFAPLAANPPTIDG